MPEEKKSSTENDKIMGILAYLGVLVVVPLFAGGNSKFVKYHANQGLVNVLFFVAIFFGLMIITMAVPMLGILTWALYFVPTVFAIMGIMNVVNNEMKPLPLIGGIKLIK
ncbi:hypothetical protein EXS53_00710 [Patescibacteria group bacterium]|nr:hypothetical protein [Patescibacteria group bacterium]